MLHNHDLEILGLSDLASQLNGEFRTLWQEAIPTFQYFNSWVYYYVDAADQMILWYFVNMDVEIKILLMFSVLANSRSDGFEIVYPVRLDKHRDRRDLSTRVNGRCHFTINLFCCCEAYSIIIQTAINNGIAPKYVHALHITHLKTYPRMYGSKT